MKKYFITDVCEDNHDYTGTPFENKLDKPLSLEEWLTCLEADIRAYHGSMGNKNLEEQFIQNITELAHNKPIKINGMEYSVKIENDKNYYIRDLAIGCENDTITKVTENEFYESIEYQLEALVESKIEEELDSSSIMNYMRDLAELGYVEINGLGYEIVTDYTNIVCDIEDYQEADNDYESEE